MEREYESAASMEAWENLGDEGQAALARKAAKRAAYIARSYGAQIDGDELLGGTWIGIVSRLNPEYLSKYSGLTMWQIAFV